MSPRRLSILALLALLLAGAAVSAYWHWSAARLAERIAAWTVQQRAEGYRIDYRGPELGGFPFALSARLEALSVESPRGWRWSTPALEGRAWLWDPLVILLDLDRAHRVSWPSTPRAPLEIEARRATARLFLDGGGRLSRGLLEGEGLRLDEGERDLAVERLEAAAGPYRPASGDGPPGIDLALELSSVTLPDGTDLPFGRDLAHLAVAATLRGPISGDTPAQVLRRWRDGSGRVDFARLDLRWGALDVKAEGDLSLDEASRPKGLFNTRSRNPEALVDRLLDLGLIERRQAAAVNLGLLALPRQADGEGAARVLLPVVLRDGIIFLGPAPVGRLAPLL